MTSLAAITSIHPAERQMGGQVPWPGTLPQKRTDIVALDGNGGDSIWVGPTSYLRMLDVLFSFMLSNICLVRQRCVVFFYAAFV